MESFILKNNASSSLWLKLAGIYNLVFGIAVILFPNLLFELCKITSPRYPEIWQCVGMIVGVYGIGYLIASRDPDRHWPIILVGLLGKILGPFGFLISLINGTLPWIFGIVILFNDIVWWPPFFRLLAHTFRESNLSEHDHTVEFHQVVANTKSLSGRSMTEMSWRQPTLVVFLRHFGCTFCREALKVLADQRSSIESLGLSIAIVHMSNEQEGRNTLHSYDLRSVEIFSDPSCEMYRVCAIERADYSDIFNLRNITKAFTTAFFKRYGVGKIAGDVFRLSGAVVIHQGKIIGSSKSNIPADSIDFLELSRKHSLRKLSDIVLADLPEPMVRQTEGL